MANATVTLCITGECDQLKLQLIRSKAVDPVVAVHTLAAGEFCSLAQFRTLHHKQTLLEEVH
jgi:hypothetical protein